jgi:hypothetical protein
VGLLENVGAQLAGAGDGHIEGLRFEPEQDSVSIRLEAGPSHMRVPVVFSVPGMQLQYQLFPAEQLLVRRPAVSALAAEEVLIPAAACFDIIHGDQGLCSHELLLRHHKSPLFISAPG